MITEFTYSPAPESKQMMYAGDFITVTVHVDESFEGKAFLRNNINQSAVRQADVIDAVEKDKANLDRGWYDLELERISKTEFQASLPLLKIGHFAYKPWLLAGEKQYWPYHDDSEVNVEPPDYRSGNTVYCAFVRQFGANKSKKLTKKDSAQVEALDKAGYTVIPPSGKFRDLIKELDHIVDGLGCNILHLLPINPTPTVYARMGRFGSPYAALDFTAVNPELAEFDLSATPLQQFTELVDEVHRRDAKIFLDIAINHTGWAAKIHETDPQWIKRNDDGSIHQPGAWGTVWEDLTELDHTNKELWIYLADVFLTWCDRGVDGFRCDAGYMIPEPAWTYITAKVRQLYPNTIFLLEGLGGPWATTESLLNTGNLNWAYSELFQNYDKQQITDYLNYSRSVSNSKGLMIHYAETHDNNRLALRSPEWAIMRTALSALFSHNGAFGFTNGVEWLADEKIFVHRNSGLNWGAKENQVTAIKNLTDLLKGHPAFFDGSSMDVIDNSSAQVICALRKDRNGQNPLLAAINLNSDKNANTEIRIEDFPGNIFDYVSRSNETATIKDGCISLSLEPGQAVCLGEELDLQAGQKYNLLKRNELTLMKILDDCGQKIDGVNLAEDIKAMKSNPEEYFRDRNIQTVSWNFPKDRRRHVLYTPASVLVVRCPHPFNVKLFGKRLYSFAGDNFHYALFKPQKDLGKLTYEDIELTVYKKKATKRYKAKILRLTAEDCPFTGQIPDKNTPVTALDTNGRGGMMHPALNWPDFNSRYDCLLGANLSKEFPENRHIMWRRMRAWCSYKATTLPLDSSTLEKKEVTNGVFALTFMVPVGLGHFVRLRLSGGMLDGENATLLNVERLLSESEETLIDSEKVTIVLRPDIEDRNFHMETKAHGLDEVWPGCIETSKKSFLFKPDGSRSLKIESNADFVNEAEWSYNHIMRLEAERGLEAHTDLFSPGFFRADLKGGKSVKILGQVRSPEDKEVIFQEAALPKADKVADYGSMLKDAMQHYIVKRGDLKTVIAGYPWFLDWGRDTLICVRGIISAGLTEDVRKILLQFASFEENGTLPNMIHGGDATNRDTSDAPLWYFVACEDLCEFEGNKDFLNEDAGGRPVKDILISIAENIISGTPNGIKADLESGLVYSPSHFTWMDTNYPAGTPREGYPVEIQSLWFKALSLLAEITGEQKWIDMKDKVQEQFLKYFWDEKRGYLSDCLHSTGGKASEAVADDALRCNQLFAVTLGLVGGKIAEQVLHSSEQLLIPGAIRSLADRKVEIPLPVNRDGQTINDPLSPYWGNYEGDEDTRRKPAYHNGTAWSWPFPSYSEAMYKLYGNKAKEQAKAILNSSRVLFDSGCINQIPEVLDGNAPHRQRGCDAQAWGITEVYRVWKLLNS